MALLTYPKFQAPDSNGINLAGGKVYFYESGTSTPLDTYSDEALSSANANPVILDSRGEADIFLKLQEYKIVLKDSSDTTIWTYDGYSEHLNVSNEWSQEKDATYVSGTQFTLVGDQTTEYHVDRRVRIVGSSTLYGTITASVYSSLTTITVSWDSGSMSNESMTSSVGLSANNDSIPTTVVKEANNNVFAGTNEFNKVVIFAKGADVASAAALPVLTDGNAFDVTGTTAITSINTLGVGTNITLQFDGALTLTHHATDLILPTGANITTAAGDIAVFNEYATGDWRCVSYTRANGKPLFNPVIPNLIHGMVLSNDIDADHDINVTAGGASDTTDAVYLELTSEITKQIDATWSAGDDAGGLSSSLTAPANNTWYHVFLVQIAGSVDVLFDTSVTCANGVTDHSVTYYRRIGSVLTDGSANILAFKAVEQAGGGLKFDWDVPVASFSTIGNQTVQTPLGIKTEAILGVRLNGVTGGTGVNGTALVLDPDITGASPSTTICQLSVKMPDSGGNGEDTCAAELVVTTNTSSQVAVSYTATLGAISIAGATLGWIDARR